MYWQENDTEAPFEVPDDVVDILFSIDCKRLPVDHAYSLYAAVQQIAPWIDQRDSGVAVHPIHVAGSQNGWERPEHGTNNYLIVSKRTKLTLRAPKEWVGRLVSDLNGKTLDISGCPLTVGAGKTRILSRSSTLFSRYVAGLPNSTEESFLSWANEQLSELGIRVRKALCGKATHLSTPQGTIDTRSLMLANLSQEESIRLQQSGLGPSRQMGCGIFIPHKGIEAVDKAS